MEEPYDPSEKISIWLTFPPGDQRFGIAVLLDEKGSLSDDSIKAAEHNVGWVLREWREKWSKKESKV